jgi:predicted DNA-binding transcriptional regulator YafY
MSNTTVAQTIKQGGRFRIMYRDHENEITERVIDVDRIWEAKSGATCVFALCHRREQYRTFDLARIIAAMPDDSTTIATFAMSAAVTDGDTEAFSRAYAAVHAA